MKKTPTTMTSFAFALELAKTRYRKSAAHLTSCEALKASYSIGQEEYHLARVELIRARELLLDMIRLESND